MAGKPSSASSLVFLIESRAGSGIGDSITYSRPAVALTIAGSDSSAGAGIQADLKTFAALGVYGVNAVTAIVAEAPGSVSAVSPVDPTLLNAQINRVITSFPISAVKIGMLATPANVEVVTEFLSDLRPFPVVVDPVLQASTGTSLLEPAGVARMKSALLPLASLATPNLPEARALLGRDISDAEMAAAPRWLHEAFGCSFLLKGGHGPNDDPEIVDYACIDGSLLAFPHPRLDVGDVHGTGCTLSSAIAAYLARGETLTDSIDKAIAYLVATLTSVFRWETPGATEPGATEALNHFPDGVDSPRL